MWGSVSKGWRRPPSSGCGSLLLALGRAIPSWASSWSYSRTSTGLLMPGRHSSLVVDPSPKGRVPDSVPWAGRDELGDHSTGLLSQLIQKVSTVGRRVVTHGSEEGEQVYYLRVTGASVRTNAGPCSGVAHCLDTTAAGQ